MMLQQWDAAATDAEACCAYAAENHLHSLLVMAYGQAQADIGIVPVVSHLGPAA